MRFVEWLLEFQDCYNKPDSATPPLFVTLSIIDFLSSWYLVDFPKLSLWWGTGGDLSNKYLVKRLF